MATKDEAKRKIAAAEKASTIVFQGMGTAIDTLKADVNFNGLGVIRDPSAVRRQLADAKAAIDAAASMLSAVDWPTDADYDYC
jgi:hypothetical protein